MRRALAAFPDAKVEDKAQFVDDQTAWIGQILAILWVLLALAVIVSLFGIVNTLVLSTFERTRELGTLRAVGMSRRQVRRMVRHESVITALVGALLGIAAGLAVAGGLTAWLSASTDWRSHVPAGSLVAVAIVAGAGGRARGGAAGAPRGAAGRARGPGVRVSAVVQHSRRCWSGGRRSLRRLGRPPTRRACSTRSSPRAWTARG